MPWLWDQIYPPLPYEKPPDNTSMLFVIAYDISNPKRLSRVAKVCEDYGMRVQYSIFECYLEPEEFDDLWLKILDEIDETEDRIVAYKLDARAAKETETAGTMICSEKAVCYLV